MKIKKTGGAWDPHLWPIYFVASNVDRLRYALPTLQFILVAVNELEDASSLRNVANFICAGKNVLIDSGVYALAMDHARAHDMSHNEALGLPPDKVDGFDKLFELYVAVMKRFGDASWGYIEIDQGGRDNKIKTRTRLEKLGLRPIPVYHPMNDGWDYFDYLAQRYDRMCFGNVVQADMATRKRLIATAWERRRKYPHLWIHALGLTPTELTTAFPMNSCDSSTWISGLRWGVHKATIAHGSASDLPGGFIYDLKADGQAARGNVKATMMCGYDAAITRRQMLATAAEQREELGADIGLFER